MELNLSEENPGNTHEKNKPLYYGFVSFIVVCLGRISGIFVLLLSLIGLSIAVIVNKSECPKQLTFQSG